jgi:DNA-nicking Smr family endonuclease
MSGRDLSDNEKKEWAVVTRHVKPLQGKRAAPTRTPQLDMPADFMADHLNVPSRREPSAPQNRANERPVRRGKQHISAFLDLHGHTQDSAWRLLPQLLSREQSKGSRCVVVITGKGRDGEGVLRRNFLRWLEMPEARHLISGFAPAHAKHGGGGAWYVYLRKR